MQVYVVWVPMSGGREGDVADATRVASDARVRHYWDGANRLGDAYRAVLELPGSAWDVFLLYDRTAVWDAATPPPPAYWMHQLPDVSHAPSLEPDRFIAEVAELLR